MIIFSSFACVVFVFYELPITVSEFHFIDCGVYFLDEHNINILEN